MRRSETGFTLIELMIVVGISALVTGALGAFYLEVRTGAAAIEARLTLEREATVVTEWLGRDLRGATAVQVDSGSLSIVSATGDPIRYRVEDGLLVRDDGERLVLGQVTELSLVDTEAQWTEVRLALEAPLIAGRAVKIQRGVLVGRRR